MEFKVNKFQVFTILLGLLFRFGSTVYACDLARGEMASEALANNTEIIVNVPAREMRVINNGVETFRLPVAVGTARYQTPLGDRELSEIVWNPSWYPPPDAAWAKGAKPMGPGPNNPLGPVKMDLGGDIRMHGTTNEASIGHAASHGCMRMKNADAKTLAKWIQLHHTQETDDAVFEKYAKERWRNFFVKLEKPIPVKIVYNVVEQNGDEISIHPDVYGKIGDKKELLMNFFSEKGLKTESIYQSLFDVWWAEGAEKEVAVSLKDLFPGSLAQNENPGLDPFEQVWLQSRHESSKKPKLTSLLRLVSL